MTAERPDITLDVVRVFTDDRGRFGNLLGIVDGRSVAPPDRQRVAAVIGYSETVYVDDPAAGRIGIFTPTIELPFAGHPTVGTAWWLRQQGYDVSELVVPAGTVAVSFDGETTRVRARPEWAPRFAFHQLEQPADVDAADPAAYPSGQHYVWAWADEGDGRVRSRMFSPSMGIAEDQATGAAAVALTGIQERDLDIVQGQGSRIETTWESGGWATVGGRVVEEASRAVR